MILYQKDSRTPRYLRNEAGLSIECCSSHCAGIHCAVLDEVQGGIYLVATITLYLLFVYSWFSQRHLQ